MQQNPWKLLEEQVHLNEELQLIVKNLVKKIDEQDRMLAEQNKRLAEQDEKIKHLEEQLKKNSRNSSKPPSSDGFKKSSMSLREKSGKNKGGQKGHQGNNLKITLPPDERVEHKPTLCEFCENWNECRGRACSAESRLVVDVKVSTNITEHDAMEVYCPIHAKTLRGKFPEGIDASVQYGTELQGLVVALNTVGAVSINRIHEILGSVFGIPLSTGTINNMVARFAGRIRPAVEAIRERLMNSPLLHADETGIRVDNKLHWVHVASSDSLTYLYLSRKRGSEGIGAENGVLAHYDGTLVHDCWAPYWNFGSRHSVCCAHLLRELQGVEDNHPEQTWPKLFKALLVKAKNLKEEAIAKGHQEFGKEPLERFHIGYDAFLRKAYSENPQSEKATGRKGRRKRGTVLALIDRLAKYKGEVCLFLNDFTIPFDNNLAERDLRMIKVKTKVSGCFRTTAGAEDYLAIMSYLSSARKQGVSAIHAIRQAFSPQNGQVTLCTVGGAE